MPDPLLPPVPAERQSPLAVRAVRKRYPGADWVLYDLTHAFQPGTATGLVGPNGSGKSTLLRVLSALSPPTQGSVEYSGFDIHRQPHQYLASVGVVHDKPDLPGYLTAVETLEWVARERGVWGRQSATWRSALLDAVLLDERRGQLTRTCWPG